MIGSQRLGRWAAITTAANMPSGDEATRLVLSTSWDPNLLPTCWVFSLHLQNSSPPVQCQFDVYVWGRDFVNNQWGRLGLNDGHLNGGTQYDVATLTDGWYYVLQNLEVWKDLYVQQVDALGAAILTCHLAPLYEQAVELRGL